MAFLGQQGQRTIPGDVIPGRIGGADVARLLGGIEGRVTKAELWGGDAIDMLMIFISDSRLQLQFFDYFQG